MKDAVRRVPIAVRARAVRCSRAALAAGSLGVLPAATLVALVALVAPQGAHAADLNAINQAARIAASSPVVASGVGAGSAVPPLGAGALLQTLFGLALVIALVFACAWVARRLGLSPTGRGTVVRTVGAVSLGGKERVAVVEIGDTWLVLGTAPGNVRLLHTLPAGSAQASAAMGGHRHPGSVANPSPPDTNMNDATQADTFGSRLRAALIDETKKRFSRPPGGDQ